jgi:hypothetical protein
MNHKTNSKMREHVISSEIGRRLTEPEHTTVSAQGAYLANCTLAVFNPHHGYIHPVILGPKKAAKCLKCRKLLGMSLCRNGTGDSDYGL